MIGWNRRRFAGIAAGLGAVWLLAACTAGEPDDEAAVPQVVDDLLLDPAAPLPSFISELELHEDDDPTAFRPWAVAYEPAWPLWTNGADKYRAFVLPADSRIGAASEGAWDFPTGTLLFKTFVYPGGDASVPVETRVIRKVATDDWEYAVYRWDESGTEAELADIDRPSEVSIAGAEGTHTIPARLQCRQCHESAPNPALGVQPWQLSEGTIDGEQGIAALQDLDIMDPTLQAAAPIDARNPLEREILGWFVGNCVHCHNGGEAEGASFDLRPNVALANTIDHPTESSAAAAGIRIVPGDPDASILFRAVAERNLDPDQKPMPPVGIDVRDAMAIERLRSFILGLE